MTGLADEFTLDAHAQEQVECGVLDEHEPVVSEKEGAVDSTSSKTRKSTRLPGPTVLRGVRYRDYVALCEAPGNEHLRMTYHNGILEIMSPSNRHERPSTRFCFFIAILCVELGIEFEAAGSTTFRKGELDKRKGHGKEPDEAFYFANAPRIAEEDKEINLDHDPPPDLWIEIDNRASSRGKLPLYAALGVPEVWRYRVATKRLWFGKLSADGTTYEAIEHSLSLPMLTPALALEALALGNGVIQSTWTKRLQTWIRETLKPGTQPS
jgi:Uma2 family endonuclease